MKSYTIHRQAFGPDAVPNFRAIQDGFNWIAFFIPFLWALLQGYWWIAAGTFFLSLTLSLTISLIGLDLYGHIVVNLGFNLLIGLYANDLARWTLNRRGYSEKEVIIASDGDHALARYLHQKENLG